VGGGPTQPGATARQPASFGFSPTPSHTSRRERASFRYFAGGAQVPEPVAVNVRNRSHAINVKVDLPEGVVPAGALVALGSALGGWSLHLIDGRLRYVHNLYGKEKHVVEAGDVLSPGLHTLRFSFEKDDGRGGTGKLLYRRSGRRRRTYCPLHSVRLQRCWRGAHLCGYEWGPAVGDGYSAPFTFNGSIIEAVVEVTGPVVRDPLAELAAIMSEQ